jgi:hypothetical protein
LRAEGGGEPYEDFDGWRDDHVDRLLSFGEALEELSPSVKAYCWSMADPDSKVPLICPFTLRGLAKIEEQVGAHAYQPIANACGFPFHPGCPRRCGEVSAPCHARPFPNLKAFSQHLTAMRVCESGELHEMCHAELARVEHILSVPPRTLCDDSD